MSKRVGILGCGWLGLPLAETLISGGCTVKGSSTREAKLSLLCDSGIEAFQILLSESGVEGPIDAFLEDLDHLVVDIPPGLRSNPDADFRARITHLIPHIKRAGIPHLIFVSSTSVFGSGQGRVSESDTPDPDTRVGSQLLEAEQLLGSENDFHTQVLRLGGLLGTDRHPVHYLSGRQIPSGGNQRVNLIRRADVIAAVITLLEHSNVSGLFHGVAPEHPTKREYYTLEAGAMGLPPPVYKDLPGPPEGKEILSERLTALGFAYSQSIYSLQ